MRIHIDKDSLNKSRSGLITGRISIEINGTFFPEREWDDFVVVILNFWGEAFKRLIENGHSEEFRFMDGPFYFQGTLGETGTLDFEFIDGRDSRNHKIIDKTQLSIPEMKMILEEAVHSVLSIIESQGWINDDIKNLYQQKSFLREGPHGLGF